MPLDSKTAAKIAKAHGLNLSDAQALSVLADDEDEANDLAEQFAPAPDGPEEMADRVRAAAQGRIIR